MFIVLENLGRIEMGLENLGRIEMGLENLGRIEMGLENSEALWTTLRTHKYSIKNIFWDYWD